MQNHTSKDIHANNNQLYLRRNHTIINTITNNRAESDNYKQHTSAPHRPNMYTHAHNNNIINNVIERTLWESLPFILGYLSERTTITIR